MTLQIGLLLALACALATNLSLLWKQKGAVAAPEVDIRRPLASAAGLFRSRWWTIGFCVALVAWVLHVAALALAPLSLVQAVVSGGLVFLAVAADRWFGFSLGRREWCGVGLTAVGLAFLGLTLDGGASGSGASYSIAAMVAFEGAMVGVGGLLLLSQRLELARHWYGVFLGAACGILFGVSDVAIKALSGTVPADPLSIVSPWTLTALLASVAAFYAGARAFQIGEGVSVIAVISAAANVAAILGGVIVFGDPLGSDAPAVIARSGAFALVVAAVALMPAPWRVASSARTG